MKLYLITLIVTCFVTSSFAQWGDNYIKLSEEITTETKDITQFEKIDVSEDFKVYIRFSDTEEKIEIEANENLHDLIVVEKEGKTLKIHTKPYSSYGGSGRDSGAEEKLVAYITAKRLTEIKGDEDVVFELLDKLSAESLTINLTEDCTIEGMIEVSHLEVKLDEDCTVDIDGSAKTMEVDANEDCKINGRDFVVGNLSIELTEDSEAKLTVNGDINLLAKEDSYFYYKGEGTFTRKKLRGDSEVKAL